jgi:hypothetical protein
MDYTYVFAFSIIIGGLISIFRFSKIRKEYYPFIYLVWLACVNESLGYILVATGHYNIINNNIYSLLEGLLLLWFFKRMNIFQNLKNIYLLFGILFIAVWTVENFFVNRFGTAFSSYYNIFSSLILVLMAITMLNDIIVKEKEILMNPAFLIGTAVVIFFTYMILVETFWLYGLTKSESFGTKVFTILSWINLLCNLIYAVAILWMRKKQPFTLQF